MSMSFDGKAFNLQNFGKKLRQLRKERDLTQGEVAKAVEVRQRYVSLWENGAARPSLESVIGLSKLFGVSTDYLLFDNVPREGVEAINDFQLYEKFRETERLEPQERKLVGDLIDGIVFKTRVRDMLLKGDKQKLMQLLEPPKNEVKTPLRKVASKR